MRSVVAAAAAAAYSSTDASILWFPSEPKTFGFPGILQALEAEQFSGSSSLVPKHHCWTSPAL